MRHPAKMMCRSVKPLPRYPNFNFLGCRPPPSWISLNFKFITDRTVTRAEVRHPAKFCRNRSNHGGDMSFSIFEDGGRHHLDFSEFQIFLTVGTVKKIVLHQRAQFRQNRLYRGRDMAIFQFFKMAAAAILDF